MNFVLKLMATKPVLTIFASLGTMAGVAVWALVPENAQSAVYATLAAFVAVAAPVTASAVLSPATGAKVAEDSALNSAAKLTTQTVGGLGELTEGAVKVVTPAAVGVVTGLGGIAGGVLRGVAEVAKGTGGGLGSIVGGLGKALGR